MNPAAPEVRKDARIAIEPTPVPTTTPPSAIPEIFTSTPPYSCFKTPVALVKAFKVVGSTAPSPITIAPAVTTANGVIAPVPDPSMTAPSVIVAKPVPPSLTAQGFAVLSQLLKIVSASLSMAISAKSERIPDVTWTPPKLY